MEISRRSREKFADLCASYGTVRSIETAYANHGFELPGDFEPVPGALRRSVCAAAEELADFTDRDTHERLLRVYLDGVDDWGDSPAWVGGTADRDSLVDEARGLIRALQRDGAPIDDKGNRALGAQPAVLPVDRFDRLGEPAVLLEHLERIERGIASDPAAAIGAAKELTESTLKFVLADYQIEYERDASLTDLYKLAATALRLNREAVPANARGSRAAQKVLQNLASAVQSLAELRNELGLGHGRTTPSPALARHARLAANSARTVVEFVLETWHERAAA